MSSIPIYITVFVECTNIKHLETFKSVGYLVLYSNLYQKLRSHHLFSFKKVIGWAIACKTLQTFLPVMKEIQKLGLKIRISYALQWTPQLSRSPRMPQYRSSQWCPCAVCDEHTTSHSYERDVKRAVGFKGVEGEGGSSPLQISTNQLTQGRSLVNPI